MQPTASLAVLATARYSASTGDQETIPSFLVFHEIGVVPS